MTDAPRVLFVSKPIVPPWHDGSKNLVRDVASHLTRARPTVLTTPGAPSVGPRVSAEPIYRASGRFAPGLVANARVLARLVTGDPHDIWHFAFAPNTASSSAARIAHNARRLLGWRGKVVQTVASAPRDFRDVGDLLFGDVVVTLSEWMRGRFIGAGVEGSRLRVIPPCARAPLAVSADAIARTRARYDLGDAQVILYPGDYEVSRGASTFAEAIALLAADVPDAIFVYACRQKTSRAVAAQAEIAGSIDRAGLTSRVRHVGEIDDLAALMAASSIIAFPVDDLYGKVDVPLVLLEALALGVPLVVASGGPLEMIDSASLAPPGDASALASAILPLLRDEALARAHAARGKTLYDRCFTPEVIAVRYDDLYEEILTEKP